MKQLAKKILTVFVALALILPILPVTQIQAAVKAPKLSKTSATLYVGSSLTLKLANAKSGITWSTKSKSIATVSKKGVVKAVKKGTTTITAKYKKKSYTCKITVKEPYLNATKKSLKAGASYTLKLTGSKASSFTTSNKKVATVSTKGVIKGVSEGSATITCKAANGKKYSCKVTVTAYLNTTKVTLVAGESKTLTIKGASVSAWSSSDTKTATVSKKGVVKAIKKGAATITCKTKTGKKYTCKVTVKSAPKPTETPTEAPSTAAPTEAPSEVPTVAPSVAPSEAPSEAPTVAPSAAPSEVPTVAPSVAPSEAPSEVPTVAPSVAPSEAPSEAPSVAPSEAPTVAPSVAPTVHVHDYTTTTYEPGCMYEGYIYYECECGDTKVERLAALGHDMQQHVKEPDCTSYGYKYTQCSRCNYKVISDEEQVPPIGHDDVARVSLEKHLINQEEAHASGCCGYTEETFLVTCSRCGDREDTKRTYVYHEYENVPGESRSERMPVTGFLANQYCGRYLVTRTRQCTECGYQVEYSEYEYEHHDWDEENRVLIGEGTRFDREEEYDPNWCGVLYDLYEVKCSKCELVLEELDGKYVSHDWERGETIKPMTFTEKGQAKAICHRCESSRDDCTFWITQDQVDAAEAQILAELFPDGVDVTNMNWAQKEEVYYKIYEWEATHVDYNYSGIKYPGPRSVDQGQTSGSALYYYITGMSEEAGCYGTCVCAGFADLYDELCEMVGLPCRYVSSEMLNHAWNQIYLEDTWYWVDVTWEENVYSGSGPIGNRYWKQTGYHKKQNDIDDVTDQVITESHDWDLARL